MNGQRHALGARQGWIYPMAKRVVIMARRKVYLTNGMRKLLIAMFSEKYMARKDFNLIPEEEDCCRRLGIYDDLP